MTDPVDEADSAPASAWDESLPPAVRSLADELLPIFYAGLKRLARRCVYCGTRSFDQIVAFSTGSAGGSCAVVTTTGNTAPTVNAGASFTVPRQTPFTLTGSASDPNGDALTYMWEEFDLGTAAPPNTDTGAVRPTFRSFVPLTGTTNVPFRVSTLLDPGQKSPASQHDPGFPSGDKGRRRAAALDPGHGSRRD